jgi:hypothetical protein
MRKFKGMIFLGNGERSGKLVEKLHKRLDDGMNWLSCGQQGPMSEVIEESTKDVVRDLISAFGYDPKGFTWNKLPYP